MQRLIAVVAVLYSATASAAVHDVGIDSSPIGGEEMRPQIVGGGPVGSCGFPSVVSVDGVCTGTLIAPQVVVTAAHCGNPSTVEFGDTTGTGLIVGTQCIKVPGQGRGADVQFCVLDFPVTQVPSTPILYGCELSLLQTGADVTLVGYGLTGFQNQNSGGIKRWTTTTIQGFLQEGSALIGTPQNSPCPGDSGGPVYIEMPDGSWRTFGTVSGGTTGIPCNGDAAYPLVHRYVPWFESVTGFDITPCHDADGTWNPGPDCGGFYSGGASGTSTWNSICETAETSGASFTCGPNDVEPKFDAPLDPEAPSLSEMNDAGGCSTSGETGMAGLGLAMLALCLCLQRRRAAVVVGALLLSACGAEFEESPAPSPVDVDLGKADHVGSAVPAPTARYHSFAEVEDFLFDVAAAHPEITALGSYGTTPQGRRLYAILISEDASFADDPNKPNLLLNFSIHGDELITVESAMHIIHRLTSEFGSNPRITRLVEDLDIFIVPVVSPDGFANQSRTVQGVDPNRQFPHPADPFREGISIIEDAKALYSYFDFVGVLDYHAFGELIMLPFGGSFQRPSRFAELQAVGNHLASGVGYTPGQISHLFGQTAQGGSADYYYRQGALAIGIELGVSKVPPTSDIPLVRAQAMEIALRYLEQF